MIQIRCIWFKENVWGRFWNGNACVASRSMFMDYTSYLNRCRYDHNLWLCLFIANLGKSGFIYLRQPSVESYSFRVRSILVLQGRICIIFTWAVRSLDQAVTFVGLCGICMWTCLRKIVLYKMFNLIVGFTIWGFFFSLCCSQLDSWFRCCLLRLEYKESYDQKVKEEFAYE